MWQYTPRQAIAFLALAGQRKRRERADELWVAYTGAQVDTKNVNQLLHDLRE